MGIARIAGIMAAKKTPELVPLCHPIALTHIEIELTTDAKLMSVLCQASVETRGVTGVEMEALNAVQVCLLTVYDMCKAMSHDIVISETRLMARTGGKKDFQHGE